MEGQRTVQRRRDAMTMWKLCAEVSGHTDVKTMYDWIRGMSEALKHSTRTARRFQAELLLLALEGRGEEVFVELDELNPVLISRSDFLL